MIPFTKKELESCASQENCYIWKEEFKEGDANDEKYGRAIGQCHDTGKYRGAAHCICSLEDSILKEITVVFYYRSNYDD